MPKSLSRRIQSQKRKIARTAKKIKLPQIKKDVVMLKRKALLHKGENKHFESAIDDFKFAEWDGVNSSCGIRPIPAYPKQGTQVNNRLADRILVKSMRFAMTFYTGGITQDIDYKIFLLRYKESCPSVMGLPDVATFFDKDNASPCIAAGGTGFSVRSIRNLEKLSYWNVLKVVKGTMKQQSTANTAGGYVQNCTKTIVINYSKPHILQYNRDGGGDPSDIATGAYVLLFVAGNQSNDSFAGQLIECRDLQYRILYNDN